MLTNQDVQLLEEIIPDSTKTSQNVGVVDESDTWTEEDISDLSKFSLQYAATLHPDDEELI
jgi:hypothetical protein